MKAPQRREGGKDRRESEDLPQSSQTTEPGARFPKDENDVSFRNSARGLPVHAGSRRFHRRGHDHRGERHGGLPFRHHRRQRRRCSGSPPESSRTVCERLRRHIRPAQREHARARERAHRNLHRRHQGQQPADRPGRPRLPRPSGLWLGSRRLCTEQPGLQDKKTYVPRRTVQRQRRRRGRLLRHLASFGTAQFPALRQAGAQRLRLRRRHRRRFHLRQRTEAGEQLAEAVPGRSGPFRRHAAGRMAGQALLEPGRQEHAGSRELAVRKQTERQEHLRAGTHGQTVLRTLLPEPERQGGRRQAALQRRMVRNRLPAAGAAAEQRPQFRHP